MRSYERSGITVDQCTQCRGVFLDRGELERLIDAEAAYAAEQPGAWPPGREEPAPGAGLVSRRPLWQPWRWSSGASMPIDRRSRSSGTGEEGPSWLRRCSIRLSTPPSEVALEVAGDGQGAAGGAPNPQKQRPHAPLQQPRLERAQHGTGVAPPGADPLPEGIAVGGQHRTGQHVA